MFLEDKNLKINILNNALSCNQLLPTQWEDTQDKF